MEATKNELISKFAIENGIAEKAICDLIQEIYRLDAEIVLNAWKVGAEMDTCDMEIIQ